MHALSSLVWLRYTLRVSDHPGLYKAAQEGPVWAVYVLDEGAPEGFQMGAASRVGLHHTLKDLQTSLELNLYRGRPSEVILELVKRHKIQRVFWDTCYAPWARKDEQRLKQELKALQVEYEVFNSAHLFDPWYVLKDDGTPYKVFTPFKKKAHERTPRAPIPAPQELDARKDADSLSLEQLGLLPKHPWHQALAQHWNFGQAPAQAQLRAFVQKKLKGYKTGRDHPALEQTSGLSAHLHFGSLSPHQVWAAATQAPDVPAPDREHFLSELTWREFSAYLLYHFPSLPSKNFQPKFDCFPWQKDSESLKAWQRGQTGYPIVDAGMRELWHTGTMHNRVRMIVASFLTKNLKLHWHLGRDWFWDCLVDADLANNSASWQWVAGSGADAAPYFRIFNPVTQGQKFDPEGTYTKTWLPELKALPVRWLFCPWEAPGELLSSLGITLGETYPHPLVDLKSSRQAALDAYKQCK